MAYMKKHCSGCCPGCHNGYAQADCTNGANSSSARRNCGCSSCGHHHGCGCQHNHGCSSCTSGCSSCGRSSGYGVLRSVTGPFSNCGNWWNNDPCFPYYTGPCGPCDPCGNCCCPDWPWPWPPMPPVMPVSNGYGCSGQSGCSASYNTGCSSTCSDNCNSTCNDGCGCNSCAADTGYTSHKNCYRTNESCSDACAARQVKPIVDCNHCKHRCDCDD